MTESVTVDSKEAPTQLPTVIKNNINETEESTNNNTSIIDEDAVLSDNSNSQHTTTDNSNQSTPSESHSNQSQLIDTESKSNTDLSIDNDSNQSNHSHSSENINNEIINEIIQENELSNDNGNNESLNNTNVSHAYRTLLVHESNRLKAENGRLLRKVEKMRCIRSSMQDIFEQLQSNDETQNEHKQESESKDDQTNNDSSDLDPLERIRPNTHRHFLLKQKEREERKKLRQQRLQRFAKSRMQKQQRHYSNTIQIQNTNGNSANGNTSNSYAYPASFIPRICSTPSCNHPLRPTNSRSQICCRGCLKNKHTPTCTQRALKMIQRRNGNSNYMPLTTPQHGNNDTRIRVRSRSHSNVLSAYHNSNRSNGHRRRMRRHGSDNSIELQNGNGNKVNININVSAIKYLYCDKCRSRFECQSDLDRHKSINHSPVIAAVIHHSPNRSPRLPPPIPELTSSFHTTMPNQTKNKFRYKKSHITLATPPMNEVTDSNNESGENGNEQKNDNGSDTNANNQSNKSSLSRLGMLGRRIRKNAANNNSDSGNNNRKRKNSLSQLFSTFMTNTRRNSNENMSEEKDEIKQESVVSNNVSTNANNNSNRRRSLSSILHNKKRNANNHSLSDTLQLSDEETRQNMHDTQRKRLSELRKKLEQRKARKNLKSHRVLLEMKPENSITHWDNDEIDLPPVPETEEKKSEINININTSVNPRRTRMNISSLGRSRSYTHTPSNRHRNRARHRLNDRPRHRRSNAMSHILPYITNSDNEDNNTFDEEEKAVQPINSGSEYDLDILALRRKVRERKLRRNGSFHTPLPHYRQQHRRDRDTNGNTNANGNGNNNPFRHHRSFRTSTNANNTHIQRSHSHSHTPHNTHTHHRRRHSHSHLPHNTNSNNLRTNPNNNFTYRSNIVINTNNNNGNSSDRPRLRQPLPRLSNEDLSRRRRNILLNNSRRRRRNNNQTSNALREQSDSNERETDNNSTSSLHVNVNINTNRDEEIARLLQQRDSLLQHFHDTIRHSHSQSQTHLNTLSAFDINALRQRNNSNNRPLHRHSQSMGNIHRLDLTYLPIRDVKESDIAKGKDTSNNCSICQEKFKIGDKVKTLPCFHFFHVNEIDRWLANSRACPVCRHSIDQINFK